jgi:hypothetical protein
VIKLPAQVKSVFQAQARYLVDLVSSCRRAAVEGQGICVGGPQPVPEQDHGDQPSAEFLVAEGWSTTSATRACACCSARRASPSSG